MNKYNLFAISALLLTAISYGIIGYLLSSHFAILVFDARLAEFMSIFQFFVSSLGFIVIWLTILLIVDLISFVLTDRRDFKVAFRLWTPVTLVICVINIFNYGEFELLLNSIGPKLISNGDVINDQWRNDWLQLINFLGYGIVLTWGVKVIRDIHELRWSTSILIITLPFVMLIALNWLF